MTPDDRTFRTKTSPYAARLATPSWIRAPPESFRPMIGTPLSRARSWIRLILFDWTRENEPPRTVKSWAKTATRRPLILPKPATTPSPGIALVGEPELGLVVGRERAHLLEGAVVEEEGEPFAGGELAPGVLLGDAVGAAALERPRAHGAKDFEMVVHACDGGGTGVTGDTARWPGSRRPVGGVDRGRAARRSVGRGRFETSRALLARRASDRRTLPRRVRR